MAGRQLTRQGVTTRTNWFAVVSAFMLASSLVTGVAGYFYEDWYLMAIAGLGMLSGIGLAVLAILDQA
jgi:hypothetical protein